MRRIVIILLLGGGLILGTWFTARVAEVTQTYMIDYRAEKLLRTHRSHPIPYCAPCIKDLLEPK